MGRQELLCARCGGPVSAARCPTCRALAQGLRARDRAAAALLALLVVLLTMLVLVQHAR